MNDWTDDEHVIDCIQEETIETKNITTEAKLKKVQLNRVEEEESLEEP